MRQRNTKTTARKVTFEEFFLVYAQNEGWNHVPEHHLKIIAFLSDYEKWGNRTGVLQAFRNAAKSTIVSAFIVWMLYCNPKLQFLVRGADDALSKRTIAECQKIIKSHPLCKNMWDESCKWREEGFNVVGAKGGGQWSVVARGSGGTTTGQRADFVIYDDFEVPKTANTALLRQRLREKVAESFRNLQPSTGRQLLVGTPHAHDSIYPETIANGASSLTIPAFTNVRGTFPELTGDITWHQRFTQEDFYTFQITSATVNEFYSQYLLEARSIGDTTFDVDAVIAYTEEVEVITANRAQVIRLGNQVITSVRCFWDPAFSNKSKRDSSVVALVYATTLGNIYIHRLLEVEGDVDEQCKQVRNFIKQYGITHIDVETNGVGATFPSQLRKALGGAPCTVKGVHTSERKNDQIVYAFEINLLAHSIHAHISVNETKFFAQLRDFVPTTTQNKDDFIDAPAKAILAMKIRHQVEKAGDINQFKQLRPFSSRPVELERDFVPWER